MPFPGYKLLIRGNHDSWWPSNAKLQGLLPPTLHFIHNTAFNWNGVSFGGSRLWDTKEYAFTSYVHFVDNPFQSNARKLSEADNEKIFVRELRRLELSLQKLDPNAHTRIALTHYPPIGSELRPSRAATILEDFKIDVCVFGHLHNVKKGALPFGEARGVRYLLTSSDYLSFTPIKVLD